MLNHMSKMAIKQDVMAARVVDIETGQHIDVGDYFGYGNDTQDKGPSKKYHVLCLQVSFLLKLFLLDISDEEDSEKGDNQKITTKNKDKEWADKFEFNLLKNVDILCEVPELTNAEKVHEIIQA